MSCSLSTIAACLAGLYLDGGLSVLDSGIEQYGRDTSHVMVVDRGWLRDEIHRETLWYSHRADNPYGRAAIGYEQPFLSPNLFLSAEIYHESSIATGRDRGVNGARINLRWYPFGARR